MRHWPKARPHAAGLQEDWVITNHILVSFHVAFISSVLVLPAAAGFKTDVLRFIFTSPETIISALFMYISFHTGIAVHEMGHFLTAARLNALSEALMERVPGSLQEARRCLLLVVAGSRNDGCAVISRSRCGTVELNGPLDQ